MTKKIFILFFFSSSLFSQPKLLSWNVANMGKSKSNSEISTIATIVKDYDIVAIQEVVAGDGGAQAVARLADELNRKGSKWDYTTSNPTSSSAHKTERYAFLWKTSVVKKIGPAWLENKYNIEIDREPYLCTFQYKNKNFTVVSFHAITKDKKPETEIKYFRFLPDQYPKLNLIFVGDFNCPQSHSVFDTLRKIGYKSTLVDKNTSLKRECVNGDCLASEFDNMYYNAAKVDVLTAGVIHFYKNFSTLKEARLISDHIPIWSQLSLK
jgi:deoxyribonuclease-1-like protein